jgi:hypothetical protein
LRDLAHRDAVIATVGKQDECLLVDATARAVGVGPRGQQGGGLEVGLVEQGRLLTIVRQGTLVVLVERVNQGRLTGSFEGL